jgi:hypothetical protein
MPEVAEQCDNRQKEGRVNTVILTTCGVSFCTLKVNLLIWTMQVIVCFNDPELMSVFLLFAFLCMCIPYVKLVAFKGRNCLITCNSYVINFFVLSKNSDSSDFDT